MAKNDGGPAFPLNDFRLLHHGMTLRDYFAAKAMQGILAGHHGEVERGDDKTAAEAAYIFANAMLKEREKP